MADGPPSQLSIDALNTATPNLSALPDIAQCTYMHGRWTPSWSIDHTYLEYHYTKEVSHIGQCTYKPKADGPPRQSSIHALNTDTPNKFHI